MRKRLKKKLKRELPWRGYSKRLQVLKTAIGQMNQADQLCFFLGHQPGADILDKNDNLCKRCGILLP